MNIAFIFLSFLLASHIECRGESTAKAKLPEVAGESFDDIEDGEEFTTKTVEAKSGSESDTDFPDELENGNFRTPVVIKVKPKKKPDAKRYSEGDNNDEENDAAKTDDHGDPSTELIRTEGKPGWVEKVLRKLRENFTISIEATGSPNAVLANRKN